MKTYLSTLKLVDEASEENSLFAVISPKNRRDLTRHFWADLFYRTHGKSINNFFCIYIWGEQGTAKSGVGQLIVLTLFPRFNPRNIVFSNEELRQRMMEVEPGEPLIRDEYQKTFGEGSYQSTATIDNYVRQLRDRRNHLICIQPDHMEMKNFHHYLRIVAFDDATKTAIAGLQNPFTNGYLGFVKFNLAPIWNNDLWLAYQKRKTEFTDDVASNDYEKIPIAEYAKQVIQHPEFPRYITVTKKGEHKLDLSALKSFVYQLSPNLTTSINGMIVQEVKMMWNERGETNERKTKS